MKQILIDLDNAVNLLSGVFNGLDTLEHEEADKANALYEDAEKLYEILSKEDS